MPRVDSTGSFHTQNVSSALNQNKQRKQNGADEPSHHTSLSDYVQPTPDDAREDNDSQT